MRVFRLSMLYLSFSLVLGWSVSAYAEDEVESQDNGFDFSELRFPDIDHHLYPEPQTPTPHAGDNIKTCVALDDEIVDLMPLTYHTMPDFYDDPKVAAAIWLTTTGVTLFDIFPDNLPLTEIPLGYSLLAYPEYKKYKEEERIRRVSLRIESLRRSKARKRCFET
ncbi:MAG: hypothetical protein KAT25_05455 [Sulfuriflexus sp.]|nr:hypothetical protein [Sulfuriflexus sp.]